MPRILAIDDDENFLQSVKNLLEYKNFFIETISSPFQAEKALQQQNYDCILLDVKMPGLDGITLLKKILQWKPFIPVIMISGQSTISTAVEALKEGAFDFIEKPLDAERLLVTIRNALEKRTWLAEKINLLSQLDEAYQIVGKSPQIQDILNKIKIFAPSQAKVLILGESGTGKELIARALHINSSRNGKPFVKVNCAAIPSELLESELFGYRKGAFTGASHDHQGKFLAADGGTLFLDEIGDMELRLQAKLLTALQDGEIEIIGENKPRKVDVRVIAASNKNLEEMITKGTFRSDLYHRLNVAIIRVPPLRERKKDIPVLAQHFLHQFAKTYNKKLIDFTPQALMILEKYDFPGNVRELKNIIEKIAILTNNSIVQADDVYQALEHALPRQSEPIVPKSLKSAVEEYEREYILKVLKAFNWRILETAKFLGINRSSLFKKMRKLGIRKDEQMDR